MKVLFDCILTQTPEKCSTNAQFVTLAEQLLQKPGVFIYWPRPKWLTDEEKATYPQDDRIKYFPVSQRKDRMKEYNGISPEFDNLLSFDGGAWDWDVLVTVRVAQIPMMRVKSVSPRQEGRRDWTKRIIAIEDMMILSLKPTVVQSNLAVQDRATLEGYLAADAVLIPAYHEKAWALKVARDHFSPARVMDLRAKLEEVCHLTLGDFDLKDEYRYRGDRKMNVCFVGRMERSNARLEVVSEVLSNQWIFNGNKVHSFICTVSAEGSPGERKIDGDAIEMRHPNRQEFHRIAREEMDVAVFYHVDVELNMSMLEPITFGVPEIVKRAPWSIGMLGEDYPLFVNNALEGYALVQAFLDDYDTMYGKFAKWFVEWFVPTYTKRMTEQGMYRRLHEEIFHVTPDDKKLLGSMAQNEIVQLIAEHGGKEFVLYDLLKSMDDKLRSLAGKIGVERGLIWATPWNEFRVALREIHGYDDASTTLGHMKKSVPQ